MKRKHFKFYTVTALAVMLLGSCTDLEIEETDSRISAGFTGLVSATSAVDQIYNNISGQLAGQDNLFALNEVTADGSLVPTRGTDWGDNGLWRDLHTHSWTPEHGFIVTVFNQWNSNQLIASQILDSRSNPTALDMGQAQFLRALSMWIILDIYGQVPFRDVTLPSSSIPEVMAGEAAVNFIIEDLNNAITNLPVVAAEGGNDNNRAGKAAARLLLAKVLLNRSVYVGGSPDSADMAQVVSLVDQIETDGYALQAGYFEIFRDSPDTETILWLEAAVGNRIWNGLHYLQAPEIVGGGWNGFSTLAEYYDLFEGDPNINPEGGSQEERRGFVPTGGTPFTGVEGTSDSNDDGFEDGSNVGFGFLINQQYDYDGTPLTDRSGANLLAYSRDYVDGSGTESLINNNEVTGVRVMKYNPRFGGQTNHEIYLRYADAHLMRAEAMMRMGQDPTAEINELRVIRGASPLGSVSESDVLDERGRELFAEHWRRNDLIRFGQYTRDWTFKNPNAIGNADRNLFPIPLPQLLANPNLVQNPGY